MNGSFTRRRKAAEPRWQIEPLEPRQFLSGAQLVKDVIPGTPASNPASLVNANGLLFFTSRESTTQGLYRSDGTAAGTFRVAQFDPNDNVVSAALGDTLYFSRGDNLWKSDGTVAGTTLVKDLTTSANRLERLVPVGDTLYFMENTSSTPVLRLWRSDGTAAGTTLVKEIADNAVSSKDHQLTAVDGELFFTAYTGSGATDLWHSDGTAAGTSLVKAFNRAVNPLVDADGTLYFGGPASLGVTPLWRSDGTVAGTVPVTKPDGSPIQGYPVHYVHDNGYLYTVNDIVMSRTQLGTGATQEVGSVWRGGSLTPPATFTADAGGRLYWAPLSSTLGFELAVDDAVANTGGFVKDINTTPDPSTGGTKSSGADYFATMGDMLYFHADDGVHGYELWRTDGTAAGTMLVADVRPGTGSSPAWKSVVGDGNLFFTTNDGTTGSELWLYLTDEAAPLATRAKAVSDARVDVTWSFPGTDAVAFKVERSLDGVSFSELARVDDPAARAYVDTAVSASTRYHYRVRAVRAAAGGGGGGAEVDSPPSNVSAATTQPLIPIAPSGLVATPVSGSASTVRLTWTDNSGNEQLFHIERRAAGGPPGTEFAEVATVPADVSEYTDGGLPGATAFEYRVRASNSHGLSDYSDTAAATTLIPRAPFGPTPVALPGLIQAEDFDLGSESIAFHDTTPGNSGNVYRSGTGVDLVATTDPGGGFAVSAEPGEWVTFSVDVSASASGTYNLELRAAAATGGAVHLEHNGVDVSGPITLPSSGSATSFRTVARPGLVLPAGAGVLKLVVDAGISLNHLRLRDAAGVTTPAAPANVAVFAVNGPAVDLTWAVPPGDVVGHWMERSTGGGVWSRLSYLDAGVTRYTDRTVSANTPYVYRLVAVNSAGESPASAEVAVTSLPAPAQLVKDIVPGGSSTPQFLTDVGGTLYFAAYAPSPGQLWRSDGTEAGTALVSAAAPDPRHLFNYDGTLLFFGRLSTSYGLWRSDGTQAGTTLVKDLGVPIPSLSTTLPALTSMTRAGNSVYFVGKGNELWKSDGTAAGTQLIKVLPTTQIQNATLELATAGDKLVFAIYKRNSSGETVNLWSSDGTDAGTQQIRTLVAAATSNITPLYFASVGGVAYFRAGENGSQRRLWRTDGTVEGTVRITSSLDPTQIIRAGNRLYYYGSGGGVTGGGLYVVDGLGATPVLVRGGVGSSGGLPVGLGGIATTQEGAAFFLDKSTTTTQVFRTDGTPAGTHPAMSNASLNTLWVVGQTLFCQVGPDQLWATDGTPGYERQVLTSTSWSPLVAHPVVGSGPRAFVMASGAALVELWQLLLPPEPPVVTMDATAPSEVTLNWNNPATPPGVPVSAFLVERRVNSAGAWSIVGETAQGVTSFTDAGLDPNVRYDYRVRAVNAGGPSPASNLVARAAVPAWLAPGSAATWDGTTLTVTGAASVVADPASDVPDINVSGAGAVLTIALATPGAVRISSLNLSNGAAVRVPAGGGEQTLVVGSLSVTTGATLDLADHAMIVRSSGVAAVQPLVAAAFNHGAWNGFGITSSVAASDPNTAIGFGSNAVLNKTSFAGVTGLTSSDVLVKFTYAGDANLDGQVDIGDLGLLAGAWQQQSGKVWFDGDFTYDGAVDIGDLGLLAGNWQKGVGSPI